jgi:Domain of unknown function (DUF4395)
VNRTIHPVTRQRFEMQGFVGQDDETLCVLRPWLRLGPAACAAGMAAGVALRSPLILWVLAVFAALGAVLPTHPFDVPYNFIIRRWAGTAAIPSYGAPRRFACALATAWISLTALALAAGQTKVALLLGSVFLVVPIVNITSDFCVISWIYQKLKTQKSTPDRASGFADPR